MKKVIPLLSLLVVALGSCSVTYKGYSTGSNITSTSSTSSSSLDSHTSTDTTTTTTTSDSSQDTSTHRSGLVEVKFAGFNDFHGHIEEENEMVGLAKMSTYIKAKKKEGAIVCCSGDTWQETFLSSECRGTIISKTFKDAGLDVYTLGNHDFDWGIDAIRLNEQAEYYGEQMLGANIMSYPKVGDTWTKSDLGKEYKTFVLNEGTEQEVKVGVVGVIGINQLTSITSKFVEDHIFYEHNEIIKKIATKLRKQENCDIVIASCHTPASELDESIFEKDSNGFRKYIDGAFCAHDHSYFIDAINGAPVLEAKSYGRYASEFSLTFNLDSRKVEDIDYNNVSLSSLSLKPDEDVKANIDALKAKCDAKGSVIYGNITDYFSTGDIGRWQTQCAAEKASELGINVDYVIVNSARSSLPGGPTNHYKMHETHPFINDLYVVKVSMSDVYSELYTYSNPFYRVTNKALENNKYKFVTILVYNYLLFHTSVNNETYEKKYNYFTSLNTSGEVPVLFKDELGKSINVLDLTINDLKKKGTIDPYNYMENSWHNSRDSLLNAY